MLRRFLPGWQSGWLIVICACCVACAPAHTPNLDHVPPSTSTATPSQSGIGASPLPTVGITATATKRPTATPAPTKLPVATATPNMPNQDFIQRAISRTNGYRQQHGCAPLTESAQLDQAALGHSQDMATHDYFAHDSPSGQTPWDRIHAAGYTFSTAAENIAAGYASPEAVIDAFYNEQPPNDGHRRNLLNCALHEVGIGYYAYANSHYHTYWTQDLGTRA